MPTIRVTRAAAHVLTLREAGATTRITRTAAHIMLLRSTEPPATIRVTRTSLHVLISNTAVTKKAWAYILN